MSYETTDNTAKEPGVPDINVLKPDLTCSAHNVPASDKSSQSSSVHYVPVARISSFPQKKHLEGRNKRKIHCEVDTSWCIFRFFLLKS
jgi:hypothetical protein